jgi:hypothetical protein
VVNFADSVGNTGTVDVEITRIDRTEVKGTVSYSTTGATNGSVIASVNFNKTGVVVMNNGGNTHYVFTGNGDFRFEFRDSAGNT